MSTKTLTSILRNPFIDVDVEITSYCTCCVQQKRTNLEVEDNIDGKTSRKKRFLSYCCFSKCSNCEKKRKDETKLCDFCLKAAESKNGLN